MAVKPRLLNYKRKKLNGNNDAVADGSVVVDEIVADDTMVEVTDDTSMADEVADVTMADEVADVTDGIYQFLFILIIKSINLIRRISFLQVKFLI